MTDKKKSQKVKNLSDAICKSLPLLDKRYMKPGDFPGLEFWVQPGGTKSWAYQRAHELLNPKVSPGTAQIIHDRLMGNMEVWMLDKEKHMANLTRIQSEAREKGQYGVAAKCEELKGKVQGFYVERNLNLNAEISADDSRDRIRRSYDREEYEEFSKREIEEIFGPEPSPEEREATAKAKAIKKAEDMERMKELEKYQEDRNRERNKKYGLKPIDER